MQQTCQITNQPFEISEQEQEFMKKIQLPLPRLSPQMREISRLAFRNERNLHMRKCSATGEKILSVYSEAQPFPVYKYDYWLSDEWNVPELEYDFNKSFFEQYQKLQRITPKPNSFSPYNENCDYVNAAEKNKNCYMHILSDRCQDCLYTHGIFASNDCIDCAYINECELCYECTDCRSCYHCRYCFLCDNSSELSFCFDCRGSQDCFFCDGLRNQRYCFFNEQLSEIEYKERLSGIDFTSHEQMQKYLEKFIKEILKSHPYIRMINNENSDGNFLINTKNCHQCYDVEDSQDCFYVRVGANGLQDVHHTHAVVDGSELIYGNVSTTESYNCHNVIGCWTTKDSCYSEFLQGCQYCMGCISLRRRKHCILNKQYSPEEYENIRQQIINEMGENFGAPFPLSLAPFSYMESAYSDYHDLSEGQIASIGWTYGKKPETQSTAQGQPTATLPDSTIKASSETISKVYICEKSSKPYKIISQELTLLKKIKAPLPHLQHEERFQNRVRFRKTATSQ
ncbi:hypothetical protein KJ632_00450 [Patescibacteria group bacterium]|nr:hypothetical protein [Patescibacteria group bacterium]